MEQIDVNSMELHSPIIIMRWMCVFHPIQALLHFELEQVGEVLNIEMKTSYFPGGNSENEHLLCRTGGGTESSESCLIIFHCLQLQLLARTATERP